MSSSQRRRRHGGAIGAVLCIAATVLAAAIGSGVAGDPARSPTVARSPDLIGSTAVATSPSLRATTPIAWCGTEPSTVDRKPDVETWTDKQIHVLYVIPSDRPDRFSQLVGRITTDVGTIDGWWQRQDPTRRPRWDLFAFPGCDTRAGQLDLRSVRLPRPAASYLDSDDIDSLIGDLVPLVGQAEKVLAYYDGPRSEPDICGTSTMAALYAGRFAYAFVWIGASCNGDLGTGGVAAATAAHELVHDLGAVPLVGPPHACSAQGLSAHVCDDPADLMFPYSSGIGLEAISLDGGHDDYYAHSGSWWDVQDSDWLTRLPLRNVAVRVASAGGAGTVTSDPPGVDCGATCQTVVDDGRTVALVAHPATGARLWGWSGVCNGWGPCVLPLHGDADVVATFGPLRYRVSVTVKGRGRVTSAPAGVDCGSRCGAWYQPGASVRLLARPVKGWRLQRWGGACTGSRTSCVVAAARDSTVRAIFARNASR